MVKQYAAISFMSPFLAYRIVEGNGERKVYFRLYYMLGIEDRKKEEACHLTCKKKSVNVCHEE